MTFENYQYTRPDTDQIKKQLETLIEKLNSANTVEETLEIFNEYNKLRNSVETLAQLVEIRATIDTTDKFYEAERDFWDDFNPELASLLSKFDKAIFDSKFKEKLKKYSETIIKVGTNVQKGQLVVIRANIEAKELVRSLTEEAYKAGAGDVNVVWRDDIITRRKFEYASIETLSEVKQ